MKLIQKEQVVAVIEDKNKTMIWVKSSGPIIIVTGAWVSTYNTDLVIDEIFNKGKRICFGNNTETPVNMTKEDRYVNVFQNFIGKI